MPGSVSSSVDKDGTDLWEDVEFPKIDYKLLRTGTKKSADIITPMTDKRTYVSFELPNGIKCLVSTSSDDLKTSKMSASKLENETDMSGVGFSVKAGSANDPLKLPGLAHFVEHMIFLSNKAYTSNNELDSYVSPAGGMTNAQTDLQLTTYQVSCQTSRLKGSLKRFAACIAAPFFKKNETNKELSAIENEWTSASENYISMGDLLITGMIADREHPSSKFIWGNRQTLEIDAEKKKVDVKSEMVSFWRNLYIPSNMAVTVETTIPALVAAKWVTRFYSVIGSENGEETASTSASASAKSDEEDAEHEDAVVYGNPFDEPGNMSKFHNFYSFLPSTPIHILRLIWAHSPPSDNTDINYISHIIGYEGENSLLDCLKKHKLAIGLMANPYASAEENTFVARFEVMVTLTERGVEEIDLVAHTVFRYIKLVVAHSPPDAIFQDLTLISWKDFNFQEDDLPQERADNLARHLAAFPVKLAVAGLNINEKFDKASIKARLRCFDPTKACVILSSTILKPMKIGEPGVNIIPRTKQCYKMERFKTSKWLESDEDDAYPFQTLRLPPVNKYLVKGFALKKAEKGVGDEVPVLLDTGMDASECSIPRRIYISLDNRFEMPKGAICLHFLSREFVSSPHKIVMGDLLLNYLPSILNDDIYMASMAGLDSDMDMTHHGFKISVAGFDKKLPQYLYTLIDGLLKMTDVIDPDEFALAKESLAESYKENIHGSEAIMCDVFSSRRITPYTIMPKRLEILPKIDRDYFHHYINTAIRSMMMDGLIKGNFTLKEVEQIDKQLDEKFAIYDLKTVGEHPSQFDTQTIHIKDEPTHHTAIRILSKDATNLMNHIALYFEVKSNESRVKMMMSMMASKLKEPAYNNLRTRQQLCYSVDLMVDHNLDYPCLFLQLSSRSTNWDLTSLLKRMMKFMRESVDELIVKMKRDEFDALKDEIDTDLTSQLTNMEDEADQQFARLMAFKLDWANHQQNELDALRSIDFKEFKQFASDLVNGPATSIQVAGRGKMTMDECDPTDADGVKWFKNKNDANKYPTIIRPLFDDKLFQYL